MRDVHTSTDASADELGVREFLSQTRALGKVGWHQRKLFVRSWIIAASLALIYFALSTREYTATTRLLPYREAQQSALAGLAGLAAVTLPSELPGQVIPAELYPELTKATSFRAQLVVVPLRFSAATWTYEGYFRDIYRPSVVELARRFTIGLPSYLSALLRRGQSSSAAEDSGITSYSEAFLTILQSLDWRVVVGMDRKTSVITITAVMPDPVAAADLARATADQLTTAIAAYQSRKASEQARFLEQQRLEVQRKYLAAQQELVEFEDRNRVRSSPVQTAQHQRLETEFTLAAEIYRNISVQLEAARVQAHENTSVLAVLDPSVVPNGPSSPKGLTALIAAIILATLAAGILVAWRELRPATT